MKVLFLSQWYPHRYDLMAGLFVQKHAEAVSLYCEVKTLFVYADENIDSFEIEEKIHSKLSEVIVYYPCKKDNLFYKVNKTINYIRAYWKGYKRITNDGFEPEIVHANILTRTAFVAYSLKLWKGIPYVVTEHWTRYLASRKEYKGKIRRTITQLVVKNASAVLPVSKDLMRAMLDQNLLSSNYQVVNNVVDDNFFNNSKIVVRQKKRIIHISCFSDEQKNISGLLRATYELSKIRTDFELIIIGNGLDYELITDYSKTLGFPIGILQFIGEKSPYEVANWMQNSDFFVMFSNYENSPVVISESFVCGKPVLSTNVGGISEHVNNTNGILIVAGDEVALLEKMNYLLDHFSEYNSDKIKADAEARFSYKNIGNELFTIYSKILNHE